MTAGNKLSFGIKTAQSRTTYEDMLRVWREADSISSIEHAWLFDHFMPLRPDFGDPCLEGWMLLAAFAAITKRLRLGLTVTSNTFRHPAVLAKMAATVDIVSGGRLDFGIGAGIHEVEHAAYGIPLYAPGERIRRLGEACELIKRMWTEAAPSFEGKYYQIKDAYCEPKPVQQPYPPFVIGGSGDYLLRVVAQYADIWNFLGSDVEMLQERNAVLERHCAAIGRDPRRITRSVQVKVTPEDLESVRSRLHAYIQAGVTHLILSLWPPYPESVVQRLDEEVVQPLKAEFEA
ncbi:MAG TPA: TIGR03560 family F420-dependent LLM class oxidoreductase [Ktedonobacterales bacterium]|nr:TIGR03560 family F420-dependent LLM class oxidoreductase [Ktedonobacterales bacterium]